MTRWYEYVLVGFAVALGFVVLLPFCVAQAWVPGDVSIKPIGSRRIIDEWSIPLLNKWYGNPEDGVSGQDARLPSWDYTNKVLDFVPYWPSAPAWLRAYAWSAWRNSANQLKRTVGID